MLRSHVDGRGVVISNASAEAAVDVSLGFHAGATAGCRAVIRLRIDVAAGVGRVVINGKDAGAGVALGPRSVVTASHVLGRRVEHLVSYRLANGRTIPVEVELQVDESLDAAALRLAEDLGEWLPMGAAVEGADWVVDSPPPGNDPSLTGTISKVGSRIKNTRGTVLEVLQLRVDQVLGDYRGYSGSGVLDRQGRAVVGLLVEQKHLRLPTTLGQPRQSSNVLYAVPIRDVVERLGLTVAAARPRRLSVEAVLADTVTRSDLLDRVVRKLIGAGPARVVRMWGFGGMGKTTVVRQAVHDARVWQAFPGGIVMVTAGEQASASGVLADLASKLGIVGLGVRDALADEPTLVVVDDVWSSELVAEVVASLPDNVVLLVTTRGTLLEQAQLGRVVGSLHVEEMLAEEALRLLARGVSRSVDLDRALGELASVLGHWPLLLSLAASEIHRDELRIDDIDGERGREPLVGGGARLEIATVELAANSRHLATAFARDPTKLDDPDSQRRSFARMIDRSLGRVSPESRERFMQLGIYPAGVELAEPVLAELWEVDDLDSRKTVRGLRRVGLVNLVSSDPITVRLHDQFVAWLHHTRGGPEAEVHRGIHRRLAALALGAQGGPGPLTMHRAEWLAFHLCRTGEAVDPVRLFEEGWSAAYLRATGSRATYLAALREVVGWWGRTPEARPPGSSEADVARSILLGGLLHAYHAAVVAEVPVEAVLADALLGRPDAAMRQAVEDPYQWRASATLVDIVRALVRSQALTPRLVELAGELVERLRNNVAQATALTGLSSVLAESRPEMARGLLERALGLVQRIQFDGDRASVLASLAVVELDLDPHHARRLLEQAVEVAEHMPDRGGRDNALAAVAEAMVNFDPDHAIELATTIGYRDRALAAFARALAAQSPEEAASLAKEISGEGFFPEKDRDSKIAGIAWALSDTDPERAIALAEQVSDAGRRGLALATIAQDIAHSHPERTRGLLGRAIELAEAELADGHELDGSRILAAVAAAMAGIDPEQAQVLLDRAQQRVEQREVHYVDGPTSLVAAVLRCAPRELDRVSDKWLPYDELGDIALRMAVIDPVRARRLVDRAVERAERRVAEPYARWLPGLALAGAAMAPFDRRRADELLGRAVDTVEQLHDVAAVASYMAGIDWPGARPFLEREAIRALRTAGNDRDYALGQIGKALAHSDPAGAVELAVQATDDIERSRALTAVATTLIASDPAWGRRLLEQAAQLAESTADGLGQDIALSEVASATLPFDSARAIEMTEQISDPERRMEALADLATAIVDTDTEQAAAITGRIDDWAKREKVGGAVALIEYLTGKGSTAPRLCAALSRVWFDLDATLWFAAGWFKTTYPAPTPPAAIIGRAVVDMMSRFFPAYLTPPADLAAEPEPARREEPE